MNSHRKPKTKRSTEERRAKVDELRERLDTFQAGLADQEVAFITAQWDRYSTRNALLIAMQRPTATDVDGFKAWVDRGRCVRKGEHGIAILAPAGRGADKTDEAGEVTKQGRQFFRMAYVFDVEQTDPLPGAS